MSLFLFILNTLAVCFDYLRRTRQNCLPYQFLLTVTSVLLTYPHYITIMKKESGWEAIKRLMGFGGKKCQNDGIRRTTGECKCQKYFVGDYCQWIKCLNGGVNVTSTDCVCVGERYRGRYCQLTNCDNGGRDNGRGSCDCVTGWYYGKYCETYGSPWVIVFGVSAAIAIFLLCLCVLCRVGLKNPFGNNRSSSNNGRRRSGHRRRNVGNNEEAEIDLEITPRSEPNFMQIHYVPPPNYEVAKPRRSETPPPTYEAAILSLSRENLNDANNVNANSNGYGIQRENGAVSESVT